MVAGVAKAWVRTGHQAPLEQRWEEAVAQLQKLSPGATVGGPRTELGLDAIAEQITRLTRPPAEPDPAIRAASQELTDLERRYHSAWLSIKQLQKQLRTAASRPTHQILKDIPPNAFADVGDAVDMSVGRHPFHNAREMRREVEKFLPAVLNIEALYTQLSAALAVDHNDNSSDGLDRRLILALHGRIEELDRKVEQLSQAPATANGSVRKRIKELSNAGHSTRAIAAIVGCSKSTVSNYLSNREG
jgi:hypothetical protein